MPNGQWQRVREYPVRLAPTGGGAVPVAGQAPQSPANDSVKQASDLLKGFLGGKGPLLGPEKNTPPVQEHRAGGFSCVAALTSGRRRGKRQGAFR